MTSAGCKRGLRSPPCIEVRASGPNRDAEQSGQGAAVYFSPGLLRHLAGIEHVLIATQHVVEPLGRLVRPEHEFIERVNRIGRTMRSGTLPPEVLLNLLKISLQLDQG